MSIQFKRDGRTYDLQFDGTALEDGKSFGAWTTTEDNALEITAKRDGSTFVQAARWKTEDNRLVVTPQGGDATDFLDATDGNIQFRLKNNQLIVDPLPDDDEFSFGLKGQWTLAADAGAVVLDLGDGQELSFEGGLKDSQSRFVWFFEAENEAIRKAFALRFHGTWKVEKNAAKGGSKVPLFLAVFSFESTHHGETSKSMFRLPVDVGADSQQGNRLLFTYQAKGGKTQWGVAFTGRFTTRKGSLVGYSAEVYDDNGEIRSRFTFEFKGRLKDGSEATRNALKFAVTIAGQSIDLTLSGRFAFTKSNLTFTLQLNTSGKSGEVSAISFNVEFTRTNGTAVKLGIRVEGEKLTLNLEVDVAITLGASRKGTVYGKLDVTKEGETLGVEALFGISLN